MTNRERELRTLSFQPPLDRGAIEETFYPWDLTIKRFHEEGLPASFFAPRTDTKYFLSPGPNDVMEYECYLGFDPVKRISFILPFQGFEELLLEEHADDIIRQDSCGRQIRRDRHTGLETEHKPAVLNMADWQRVKAHAQKELDLYFTDEAIAASFAPLKAGQETGSYSVRMNIEGFFWTPRELMGITNHLYNFYDEPELIHEINEFVFGVYAEKLMKVLDYLTPDLIYIMEDLSGKDGPMISAEMFDEFVGAYYRRLIPLLREKGVQNIFVDTDGDFARLIPNFMAAGVDGFLPMDVNAGMDIVKVRQDHPGLKFIGGYNKLCIAEGREAIDREFERLLPVIRGGGYIVGADHQVAPSTSFALYRYYIERLTEYMLQAGKDCAQA